MFWGLNKGQKLKSNTLTSRSHRCIILRILSHYVSMCTRASEKNSQKWHFTNCRWMDLQIFGLWCLLMDIINC